MGLTEFALDETAIVVRGTYVPTVISPEWLRAQKLVGDDDVSTSEIEIISPAVTVFTVGALRIQVTPDLLQISTEDQAETERARDLVIGLLRTLEHTPVSVLGINRAVHFTPATKEEWHAIGDRLVPKSTWEDQHVLELPGTLNVTLQGVRPDQYEGYVQVQVQPSGRVASSVYVSVNDHFSLELAESKATRRDDPQWLAVSKIGEPTLAKLPVAVEVLTNEWNSSRHRAKKIIDFVASLGRSPQS